MDRDGRGKPSPGEFSSFDLSKMSEAEVAAELAARMARWRRARKTPGNGANGATREPPAEKPTPQPTAAQFTTSEAPVSPREVGLATAARIDHARRIAAQGRAANGRTRPARHAPPYGAAFTLLLAEGPNRNAIGMGPEDGADQALPSEAPLAVRAEDVRIGLSRAPKMRALSRLQTSIDQALTHARALGATAYEAAMALWRTCKPALEARMHQALDRAHALIVTAQSAGMSAWRASAPLLKNGVDHTRGHARAIATAAMQARTDRFVIAGLAAIAMAIAGWLAMTPDQSTPPDAAHPPQSQHPHAIASASAAPQLSQIPPPREIARLPQPQPAPDVAEPDAASAADSARLPARLKPMPRAPMLAAQLKPDAAQPATPIANRQATAQPTTTQLPSH